MLCVYLFERIWIEPVVNVHLIIRPHVIHGRRNVHVHTVQIRRVLYAATVSVSKTDSPLQCRHKLLRTHDSRHRQTALAHTHNNSRLANTNTPAAGYATAASIRTLHTRAYFVDKCYTYIYIYIYTRVRVYTYVMTTTHTRNSQQHLSSIAVFEHVFRPEW